MTVSLITNPQRYAGLSTDVRPTTGVPVGSVLEELDTGDLYEFLGGLWVQVPTSPGGGGDPVTWGNIGAGGAPDPLGDNVSLAFDTGGDYYLRYSTAHGDLYWSGQYLTMPGSMQFYANTDPDGNGVWSPWVNMSADGGPAGVEQYKIAVDGVDGETLVQSDVFRWHSANGTAEITMDGDGLRLQDGQTIWFSSDGETAGLQYNADTGDFLLVGGLGQFTAPYGLSLIAGQTNGQYVPRIDLIPSDSADHAQIQLAGRLIMPIPGLGHAALNLPLGTPPTSPANQDLWPESDGLHIMIGGVEYKLDMTAV